MTREHIFARWLVRKTHGARLLPSGRPAPVSEAALPLSKVVVPVCAECNAGWMSSLEVSFRQILFAGPRVGEIQRPTRVTLSRWFTKTAVLLAQALGAEVLAAEERSKLMFGMPENIEVLLARRRRARQRLDYGVDLVRDASGDRVRAVALQVDDVLAHVAPSGSLSSAHGTRLWPLRSHTMRWDTLPVITRPLG